MRKSIALVLLVTLLPTVAMAQSSKPPQPASGNKTKLLALGSVIGGVGLMVLSTTTGKQTSSATTTGSPCIGRPGGSPGTAFTGSCSITALGIGGSTAIVQSTAIGGGAAIGGTTLQVVGGSVGSTSLSSPFTRVGALSMNSPGAQGRGTNWKLVGPAIGAIGVGTFVLYRSHVSAKRADLSVRPSGAVQLSYKW